MPLQIICIIPFMRLGELLLGAEKLGADHITLKASCSALLEHAWAMAATTRAGPVG